MNHTQNYITQQTKICREEWFKDHRAKCHGFPKQPLDMTKVLALIINWQKPGTWNYGCRFIIHRRWLCVVGDIGEATFEWSEDLTLTFLAQIDFGYFLSKCRASPSGNKFEQWDSKIAWLQASDYIKELKDTPPEDQTSSHDQELGALDSLSKDSAVEDYRDAAQDIYRATGEVEICSIVSDWGNVPSCHAIGMFVGLQMAISQLKGEA